MTDKTEKAIQLKKVIVKDDFWSYFQNLVRDVVIPYQEKIRGISMVDTKKAVEWQITEEGIRVVIPKEYREGDTPIAIVWKIER